MPTQVCAGSFMQVGEFVWMPKDRPGAVYQEYSPCYWNRFNSHYWGSLGRLAQEPACLHLPCTGIASLHHPVCCLFVCLFFVDNGDQIQVFMLCRTHHWLNCLSRPQIHSFKNWLAPALPPQRVWVPIPVGPPPTCHGTYNPPWQFICITVIVSSLGLLAPGMILMKTHETFAFIEVDNSIWPGLGTQSKFIERGAKLLHWLMNVK